MSGNYFAVLNKIGDSPVGEVFACYDPATQRKLSLLQLDAHLCKENFDAKWKGLTKSFQLRHDHLEPVIDSDKTACRIVLPERGRSLGECLRSENSQFPQHIVRCIVYDMLSLLDYFQQKNFIHGDIRPDTLLLPVDEQQDRQSPIRLAYSSGIYFHNEIIFSRRNRKYLTPEMINPGFGTVSVATDLYCLAFTALVLLLGNEFNTLFRRIGPDGQPHWTVLHGVGDERLPPLKEIFPGMDNDLKFFFLTVLTRKVADRPGAPRTVLAQMKNRYIFGRIFSFLRTTSIHQGVLHVFREHFSNPATMMTIPGDTDAHLVSDEHRCATFIGKAIEHLKGFSVSDDILNELAALHVMWDKVDSYADTISIPDTQCPSWPLQQDTSPSGKTNGIDTIEYESLVEKVSDLSDQPDRQERNKSSQTQSSFVDTLLCNLTRKTWWDTQFKKKSVLYGLFGTIAAILLLLLMISSFRLVPNDFSTVGNEPNPPPVSLPDGFSGVGDETDPDTGWPLRIEVKRLKETAPLEFVFIKPAKDSSDCKPFYIAMQDVSVTQFEHILDLPQSSGTGKKTQVSHMDSRKFCQALGGDLPTEAQWKSAASAELPGNMLLGPVAHWCSEPYQLDAGEAIVWVGMPTPYLIKGHSFKMFAPPATVEWRAPAAEQGAADIGFRPVIMFDSPRSETR